MRDNIFDVYDKNKILYLFKADGGSVLFKPLTYKKCRVVEKILKEYPSLIAQIEDNIWEECVIEHSYPSSLHDMPAGIPSTLAKIILSISRPATIDQVVSDLEKARQENRDVRDEIIVKICEAFPAYYPDMLEDMDWDTLIKRLVQAEKILKTDIKIESGQQDNEIVTRGVATKKGSDGRTYIDFEKENQYINNGG